MTAVESVAYTAMYKVMSSVNVCNSVLRSAATMEFSQAFGTLRVRGEEWIL